MAGIGRVKPEDKTYPVEMTLAEMVMHGRALALFARADPGNLEAKLYAKQWDDRIEVLTRMESRREEHGRDRNEARLQIEDRRGRD